MIGQPSPNQGGIAQLAGGMGGMGGMGGSPTLGGAPQTPPMPQGGAQKPPQQAPQGGLPPDLLKALAAAKVKKMQDAAKRELELQMAQQQAASGEGNKTVVQQLQEGVEKDTAQEMMQALSGGLKQAGQMSAQPQGQPMSGGIAAAPGANQAAQPEVMASGGIVAFASGAGGNGNKGAIPAAILQNQDEIPEGFHKEPGSDFLIPDEDKQPVAATLQPRRHILSGLPAILEKQIAQEPSGDAEMEKYQKLMAVEPELAKQLAADTARVRATAESKGAPPTWQESLYAAMPKGRPQPGSSIFTTISDAVGGINALDLQRKGEKEAAEKELLGMSRTAFDKRQTEQKEAYGISKNEKTELRRTLDNALTVAGQLYGNDSTTMASMQAALSKNPLEIEFYANNYLESQRAKGDNRDKSIIKNEGIIKFVEAKAKTEVGKGGIAAQLQGVQTRADVDREQLQSKAYDLAVKEVNDLEAKGFSPTANQLRNAKRDDKKNGTNTYKEIKDRLINDIYLNSPAMKGAGPGTPAQSAPPTQKPQYSTISGAPAGGSIGNSVPGKGWEIKGSDGKIIGYAQ